MPVWLLIIIFVWLYLFFGFGNAMFFQLISAKAQENNIKIGYVLNPDNDRDMVIFMIITLFWPIVSVYLVSIWMIYFIKIIWKGKSYESTDSKKA